MTCSDKVSQATHVSMRMGCSIARYYHIKGDSVARLDVKNNKWVMAGDWVIPRNLVRIKL